MNSWFSWLKKHFVPHEGNEHRPHILRDYTLRKIVLVVILLEAISFLIPTITHLNTSGGMAAVLPAVLANLTNEERQTQNLPALTVSPILNKAAEMKAADMALSGYFAHTSPEGKTPWYWLEKAGYEYQYAGENLAINFSDSKDVTEAWMRSPTHKANIVKGNYTEVGTGIATGMYKGAETVFVAQVYANPLPKIEEKTQPVKEVKNKNIEKVVVVNTKNKVEPIKESVEEKTNVLGAETTNTTNPENIKPEVIKKPTFWQNLMASPRNTTNAVLYLVFVVVLLALVIYIFVKIRNHQMDLITNGLIVLAIIGAIFVVNYYLSHRSMVILEAVDYQNKNI